MSADDRQPGELTAVDRGFLRRCVDLARESLEDGDEPFGSLLVDGQGVVRLSDRNRQESVVYTSGEHCPMCSAAHAWVGLGPIVYASSSEQLVAWRQEWGFPPGPVNPLPINAVAPDVSVAGPDPQLAAEIRLLHARMWGVADG
jgi:tRNA(Arg) A34 adenosine deaminase TadA